MAAPRAASLTGADRGQHNQPPEWPPPPPPCIPDAAIGPHLLFLFRRGARLGDLVTPLVLPCMGSTPPLSRRRASLRGASASKWRSADSSPPVAAGLPAGSGQGHRRFPLPLSALRNASQQAVRPASSSAASHSGSAGWRLRAGLPDARSWATRAQCSKSPAPVDRSHSMWHSHVSRAVSAAPMRARGHAPFCRTSSSQLVASSLGSSASAAVRHRVVQCLLGPLSGTGVKALMGYLPPAGYIAFRTSS